MAVQISVGHGPGGSPHSEPHAGPELDELGPAGPMGHEDPTQAAYDQAMEGLTELATHHPEMKDVLMLFEDTYGKIMGGQTTEVQPTPMPKARRQDPGQTEDFGPEDAPPEETTTA